MPRNGLTADFIAAMSAPLVRPAIFVAATFADQTIYLWSGLGSKTWNGQTWVGAGELMEVSTISEDSTIEAKGITLSVSGIPASLLNEVLNQLRITRTAQVWLALFNADGSLVASPVLSYSGLIDQPTVEDGVDTCTVSIALENVLVDFNRSVWRRYTDADQKMDYPTDTGFQFVQGIQEVTVYWGVVPGAYNQ